jgi:hypothetical protein
MQLLQAQSTTSAPVLRPAWRQPTLLMCIFIIAKLVGEWIATRMQ